MFFHFCKIFEECIFPSITMSWTEFSERIVQILIYPASVKRIIHPSQGLCMCLSWKQGKHTLTYCCTLKNVFSSFIWITFLKMLYLDSYILVHFPRWSIEIAHNLLPTVYLSLCVTWLLIDISRKIRHSSWSKKILNVITVKEFLQYKIWFQFDTEF